MFPKIVGENPTNHPIFNRESSIIFTIHFGGNTPICAKKDPFIAQKQSHQSWCKPCQAVSRSGASSNVLKCERSGALGQTVLAETTSSASKRCVLSHKYIV